VKYANRGIDWDNGKFILSPEVPMIEKPNVALQQCSARGSSTGNFTGNFAVGGKFVQPGGKFVQPGRKFLHPAGKFANC